MITSLCHAKFSRTHTISKIPRVDICNLIETKKKGKKKKRKENELLYLTKEKKNKTCHMDNE